MTFLMIQINMDKLILQDSQIHTKAFTGGGAAGTVPAAPVA